MRVKLSIEASTGRVATSVAESEHRDTPLGRCVAAAFAEVRFPPTRRHGVSYSLTMD